MSNAVTSPDFITIITNVGVLLAAIGTVIAAIWSAVKKIKTMMPEDTHSATKVVGGSIMDTTTMIMFVESQRELMGVIRDMTKETMELRFAVTQLKDSFDG